jgi:hypothetical protein
MTVAASSALPTGIPGRSTKMSEPRRDAIGIGSPADPHRKIMRASDSDADSSPGLVLWEIGRVIAVCLGLAVAANLLVAALPGP